MPPADPSTTTTTTVPIATLSPANVDSPLLLTVGQTALVWLVAVLFFIFIFLAALLASCAHPPSETRCSCDRHRRRRRRRVPQNPSETSCSCSQGDDRTACDDVDGDCDRMLSDDDDDGTPEDVRAVVEGERRSPGSRFGRSQQQQPHYRQETSRRHGRHPTAGCVDGGRSGLALTLHPTPVAEASKQQKKLDRASRALMWRNGGSGSSSDDDGSQPSCSGGGGDRRGASAERLPSEWDDLQMQLATGSEDYAWPYVMPPAPPPSRAGSEENLLILSGQ